MKRPVFIIIGVVLVFILLGIWIYILFFGSPTNNQNTFADLGFNDTTDTTVILDDSVEQPVIDVTGPERLRQLTTKQVIGYRETVADASSTPEVLYIEAGTGHIFSINLTSGEEKRVSATTIPLSTFGEITPNGQFVMIQSGSGIGSEFTIGELSSTSDNLITKDMSERVVDFKATNDNTFLYAVQTSNSVIAKEYHPLRNTSQTLFTIPFREASIDWGELASDTHYAYPKASSKLEGFLYQISNGKVKRLPVDGFGLSAIGTNNYVIYSKQLEGEYQTFIYNSETDTSSLSVLNVIPEKCVPLDEIKLNAICGSINSKLNNMTPDRWYQGIEAYADDIWEIDTSFFSATLHSQTLLRSGRELDIVNLVLNQQNTNLYFTNKNDNSLWTYALVETGLNN